VGVSHKRRPDAETAKHKRRERLLRICAAFLRSACAHADRILAQDPVLKRSKIAQTQYDVAVDMAETIEQELALGRRWDDSRNPIRPRRGSSPSPLH
jgi:hypothetical protein